MRNVEFEVKSNCNECGKVVIRQVNVFGEGSEDIGTNVDHFLQNFDLCKECNENQLIQLGLWKDPQSIFNKHVIPLADLKKCLQKHRNVI